MPTLREGSKRAKDIEAHRAARVLGRLGGLKGGPARARALSASQRSYIAKKAARASHGRHGAAGPEKGSTHK